MLLGMSIMRFSASRITVWRSVISITVPLIVLSTSTKSPNLNGWEKMMNMPPTTFDSASCEAKPTAMATIPALASIELLTFSMPGISERNAATPIIYMAVIIIRRMKLTLVSSKIILPCRLIERRNRYFVTPVSMRTNRYMIIPFMAKPTSQRTDTPKITVLSISSIVLKFLLLHKISRARKTGWRAIFPLAVL